MRVMLESRTGFHPRCGCGWNEELNPDTETPAERTERAKRGAHGRPHTHTRAHAHTAGHTRVHTQAHERVHTWLATQCVCTWPCTHTHGQPHTHTCTNTCVHMWSATHMHAHTWLTAHAHACACTCSCTCAHTWPATHTHRRVYVHARTQAHAEGKGLRQLRFPTCGLGARGGGSRVEPHIRLGPWTGAGRPPGFEGCLYTPQGGAPGAQLLRHCGAALGRAAAAGGNRLPCACAGDQWLPCGPVPCHPQPTEQRGGHGGSGGRRRGLSSLTGP